ncbi:YxeA family protein [Cytobacillus massiliigabonensis]|uniref:YxeA family protein n=1 Tax=Cytobacillus massiliigabonensis TaxID=1871011 RepID=UPI000C832A11|nr:YxeA family protein [Cytobacillus massiliigabonensis]
MKKFIGFIAAIAVFLVGGLVILQNVNFNRLGADEYYTQIIGQGKKLEDKSDNGQKYVAYEYKLSAFDKDGRKKTLTFTAQKQLRENAYLSLFVKDSKGVTSYQEVKKEELPKKASEKLSK